MPNRVFEAILDYKVENFKDSVGRLALKIFVDPKTGKMIHPGEFGQYKEKICADFFSLFIPTNYDTGTGFVITPMDDCSTQCDVIVFESSLTPVIRNDAFQRFFPVETVAGVVEIKSKLSKTKLKEALVKLSNVKKLRERTKSTVYKRSYPQNDKKFDPTVNRNDQVFSILVCNALTFDTTKICKELDDFYLEENILQRHRHNMILSVEDGLIYYEANEFVAKELGGRKSMPYPEISKMNMVTRIDRASSESNHHFFSFAHYFNWLAKDTAILEPDIGSYIVDRSPQFRDIGN